jgi:hypothetical protein
MHWLLFLGLVLIYGTALVLNLTESNRRSLRLRDDADADDHILASVLVTAVNPATQELAAQITLRPLGTLAQDEVTPATDLSLFVNNVSSPQQFDFPKGKRMNRVNVVFPMNGDLNRYPFDHYVATLRLVMSTPARKKRPNPDSSLPTGPEDQILQSEVGTSALQTSTLIPITLVLTAATPGIKFEGGVYPSSSLRFSIIGLRIRRANNVIGLSVLIMILMGGLAISLLAMVSQAISGPKLDLVPLSICISLIFGLPALRNVQPGVPPVGAFGDYVSFIWAELVVGVSAILIIWTWVLHSREKPPE